MTEGVGKNFYTIEMAEPSRKIEVNPIPGDGMDPRTGSQTGYSYYMENLISSQYSSVTQPAEKAQQEVSNLPLQQKESVEESPIGSELPLSPIEEQLAKNEESKESLPAVSNAELEKAILEQPKKAQEKVKKIVESASQSKPAKKKEISRQRRYESSTVSWNQRRPKSGSGRNNTFNRSSDKSQNLNDQSLRKSVRDKYMMNRDWLKKMENNRKANYNHFNLAKKAQYNKTQYQRKKAEEKKAKQ